LQLQQQGSVPRSSRKGRQVIEHPDGTVYVGGMVSARSIWCSRCNP
jgi:hypothetical protein